MSDEKTGDKEVRFTLRVPEGLYSELVEWSEEEMRSLHAHILFTLRDAVRRHKNRRAQKQETEEDILTPELVAG